MDFLSRVPLIFVLSFGMFALLAGLWLFALIEDAIDWWRKRSSGADGERTPFGLAFSLHRNRKGPPGQRTSKQGPHRGIPAPHPRLRADRANRQAVEPRRL